MRVARSLTGNLESPEFIRGEYVNNFKSYCAGTAGSAAGCLFRMTQSPPNDLYYDEYMTSHQEALERMQANGMLKGDSYSYERDQPRYGCPTSQEERGRFVLKIERDVLEKCIEEALVELPGNYDIHDDAGLIAQNTAHIVERENGVFPNINMRMMRKRK